MFEDKTYKRCGCHGPLLHKRGPLKGTPKLDPAGNQLTGPLDKSCPLLNRRDHGSWYYSIELDTKVGGKRQRAVRGGFKTQKKAAAAAKTTYEQSRAGLKVLSKETLGNYMAKWLEGKQDLATTTVPGYERHIRLYISNYIGHVPLIELDADHIREMFKAINDENERRDAHRAQVEALAEDAQAKGLIWRQTPPGDARAEARAAWNEAKARLTAERKQLHRITDTPTQHRIKATLSSALEDAVKALKVVRNWAALVELPTYKRPKALVWTAIRVAEWARTGERPSPVMVWTPELTGAFLDAVAGDRLYPLWHLFALRGLRRGEGCALQWSSIDLEARTIHISHQVVAIASKVFKEDPKADSVRTITIDRETVELLRRWQAQQTAEREAWNEAHKDDLWKDTGAVFTKENGEPHHPDYLTHRFELLITKAELPPIRLHDLRHGTAGISNAAGMSMKDISELLGHSGIQITADTYTSVFPQFQHAQAEATLAVVPRANRVTPAAEAASKAADPTRRERAAKRKRIRVAVGV
ncbi:tyrosine-type recombinase/integrase [Kitasatospora sp. NPDC004745]|uniref:tyrosine-type recombinase/integrase n=1 Tax=Kitasatospora sp. NPDC004745 TaxID=3364019 RepID=UPI0036D18F6E